MLSRVSSYTQAYLLENSKQIFFWYFWKLSTVFFELQSVPCCFAAFAFRRDSHVENRTLFGVFPQTARPQFINAQFFNLSPFFSIGTGTKIRYKTGGKQQEELSTNINSRTSAKTQVARDHTKRKRDRTEIVMLRDIFATSSVWNFGHTFAANKKQVNAFLKELTMAEDKPCIVVDITSDTI